MTISKHEVNIDGWFHNYSLISASVTLDLKFSEFQQSSGKIIYLLI